MKTTQKNKIQAFEYAAPDLTVMSKITQDVILASEDEYDVGQDTKDF